MIPHMLTFVVTYLQISYCEVWAVVADLYCVGEFEQWVEGPASVQGFIQIMGLPTERGVLSD